MALAITLDDVRAARRVIAQDVLRTPMLPAPKLSDLTGANVFVKYENLQVTNSFKERGALAKLLSLTADERRRGVTAMSAGNHAQALAYHANRLGIPATVVMPRTAPITKIVQTEGHRATVVIEGETYDAAYAHARLLEAERGLTYVHAFDDPRVIAGQGTVAIEMLEDVPAIDTLLTPIGGGGLISGMGVVARASDRPIEVIGVEVSFAL